MRQVLRAGALGRLRGMGWGGKWEGRSGWGTHVNPWLIHVNVWQKPLQYCKVISLQLINEKKERSLFCLIFHLLLQGLYLHIFRPFSAVLWVSKDLFILQNIFSLFISLDNCYRFAFLCSSLSVFPSPF